MNNKTLLALGALSLANLALSAGTLTTVVLGARRVEQEIEEIRLKATKTTRAFKAALSELD